jgi:glycosyltransferase involved in cell wall biosynthesis
MNKNKLIIIQSTHASLGGLDSAGLLKRHIFLIREYSKVFDVVIYSNDTQNYSERLGIIHKYPKWLPKSFGFKHFFYYLWLVLKALQMKGFIKVFGSNIPTLPLVKIISRQKMMVTYQWDYEKGTLKNYSKGLKSWLPPLLEKLAIKPADIVLVTTPWLKEKIEKVYHKKTVLLPNWVDFSKIENKKDNNHLNNKTIIYAGRLHWSKGIDILIDAYAKLYENYHDIKLIICGDGEKRKKLEEKVNSNGIKGIDFKGKVSNDNVLNFMSNSRIFVLPTLTMEGHPKALIEAMAAKCICLASNVPGNREVLKDAGCEENLFESNNVDSLYEKLLKAMKTDNSDKTYSYAKENYSADILIKKDIEVLKKIIGGFNE